MALKISGVSITANSKISGKTVTSISKIAGGISTSSIPGWPSSGPTCTTIYLGYSDGRRFPPEFACQAEQSPYDYDSASGVIYFSGGCGNEGFIASPGYYSDGGTIYDFTSGYFYAWAPCER